MTPSPYENEGFHIRHRGDSFGCSCGCLMLALSIAFAIGIYLIS